MRSFLETTTIFLPLVAWSLSVNPSSIKERSLNTQIPKRINLVITNDDPTETYEVALTPAEYLLKPTYGSAFSDVLEDIETLPPDNITTSRRLLEIRDRFRRRLDQPTVDITNVVKQFLQTKQRFANAANRGEYGLNELSDDDNQPAIPKVYLIIKFKKNALRRRLSAQRRLSARRRRLSERRRLPANDSSTDDEAVAAMLSQFSNQIEEYKGLENVNIALIKPKDSCGQSCLVKMAQALLSNRDVEVIEADQLIYQIEDVQMKAAPVTAKTWFNQVPMAESMVEPLGGGRRRLIDIGLDNTGRLIYVPNDPSFRNQWHLDNTSTASSWLDYRLIDLKTKRVKVGVTDSGIDVYHPDLMQSLWTNILEAAGLPGVDDDGNNAIDDIHGYNAMDGNSNLSDDNGHGTAVTGVIAARNNNQLGVSGISWVPDVITCKMLSGGFGTTSAILGCFDYLLETGCQVVTNSWAGSTTNSINAAIQEFGNRNVLMVFAAGNQNSNIDEVQTMPAALNYSNMLKVAAMSQNKPGLWSGSNYGPMTVQIAAPGDSITTTNVGGSYGMWAGTSFATPVVTGAVASLLALDPKLTYSEIMSILQKSVVKSDSLSNLVTWGGSLDAQKAFETVLGGHKKVFPTNGWMSTRHSVSVPSGQSINYTLIMLQHQPGKTFSTDIFVTAKGARSGKFVNITIPIEITSLKYPQLDDRDIPEYPVNLVSSGYANSSPAYLQFYNRGKGQLLMKLEGIEDLSNGTSAVTTGWIPGEWHTATAEIPADMYVYCAVVDTLTGTGNSLNETISGNVSLVILDGPLWAPRKASFGVSCHTFTGNLNPSSIAVSTASEFLPVVVSVKMESQSVLAATMYQVLPERGQEAQFTEYQLLPLSPNTTMPFIDIGPIAGTERIQSLEGIDDGRVEKALKRFTLYFYNQTYSQIVISTNGLIAVNDWNSGVDHQPGLTVANSPAGVIAPFWRDLKADAARSRIYMYEDEFRLAVQWTNMVDSNDTSTSYTFQAIVLANGDISFVYKNISRNVIAQAGIKDVPGRTITNLGFDNRGQPNLHYGLKNEYVSLNSSSNATWIMSISSSNNEITPATPIFLRAANDEHIERKVQGTVMPIGCYAMISDGFALNVTIN